MQPAMVVARKILCAIDFSDASRRAMYTAARLSKAADAELVLLHAWYVPPLASAGEYPFPPSVTQQLVDDDERGLALAAREASELGARHVKTQLSTGIPWDQIVEALRRDPTFDLVVLGPHGRTAFARVLLGSVTEKVARHAPCPVLVARGEAKPFGHVLCPVDFSDSSREALALAVEMTAPNATLTLLHVIELPLTYTSEVPVAEGDYLGGIDKRSTDLIEDWASDLRTKTSLSIATRVETGSPGATVLAALDEDPTYDLVAMGRHGRTGVRRVLLGSVAEKVVRHARCSVVVARPRAT
jgi:nucleotide-binding universal stress UspA family protein